MICTILFFALLYTLPNFFGETPAVQISSARATVKLDERLEQTLDQALKEAGITHTGAFSDANSLRFRFEDTETQLRARDIIEARLNPDAADPSYIVALNLLSASPGWLTAIGAKPMYLGLDLRGGVHFLLEVDMAGALTKRLDATSGDIRTMLRDQKVRHAGISRDGNRLVVRFNDEETRTAARRAIERVNTDFQLTEQSGPDGQPRLVAALTPQAEQTIREFAIRQNITTLHNRINELGVAEPVIQQQGANRIVVQLPGVQDVAKAKDILGRTATLEIRMVNDDPGALQEALAGRVPFGYSLFSERGNQPVLIENQVLLTGDRLTNASPGFDGQTHEPAVHLELDQAGARIFRDLTRENVNKRMAILLFEKGKGEVVTAPVIRGEIPNGRVQISGAMSTTEAADIALLLRAGSLAAPMDIIEERTIGPSLGAENITKGFHSVMWGFAVIVIFMCLYYGLFGVVSSIALAVNLLLLMAILSMLQATLTLPGIAAMALALGMAIDSNVLINERIREELRAGASPQAAIHAGYERAWATILDSNISTLIVGVALLAFGSGPVRGFAVVHCIGILTSMFSAVFFSRGLVNLWYGRQKKLKSLSIGTVWRPDADDTVAKAE